MSAHGGPIPSYAMLDIWMALHGTSHPEFDEFYAEHGYAETWARLCAAVKSRRQGPITDEVVVAAATALAGMPWENVSARARAYWIDEARAALEAAERVRSAVPTTTEPSDQWVTAPDGEVWRVGACQGHDTCPVETHEHGCFADVGNCDHPEEHEPTEGEKP